MIRIQNLRYSYPSSPHPSLKDISLEIGEGSLFGLLGPNGAGKTTLLSILSGLLPCPPGQVWINDLDLAQPGTLQRTRLALVPQEYAFYLPLTVQQNLEFFAGVQGLNQQQRQQRIARAAAQTGLSERLGDRAGNLSGGLKRRLNLAIGLLNEPRLLLLDEPTVGIDPHSRHFILQTIAALNAQGTTVIYTSHYMEEVESLCDRIAIVDHGEIRLQGELQALLEKQGSERLSLELQQPLGAGERALLPALVTVSDCGRQLDAQPAGIRELLSLVQQLQHLGIVRVRYGQHNLESLFLDLTHRSLRD